MTSKIAIEALIKDVIKKQVTRPTPLSIDAEKLNEARTRNLAMMRRVHELAAAAIPTIVEVLTPQDLANAARPKSLDGPVLGHVLVGTDGYSSLLLEPFTHFLDPVSRHEKLLIGELATVFGLTVYTDRYFHPEDHVIPNPDVYVFSRDAEGNVGADVAVIRIVPKE